MPRSGYRRLISLKVVKFHLTFPKHQREHAVNLNTACRDLCCDNEDLQDFILEFKIMGQPTKASRMLSGAP